MKIRLQFLNYHGFTVFCLAITCFCFLINIILIFVSIYVKNFILMLKFYYTGIGENMEQEVISGQNNIRMTRIEKLTDLADLGVNPYPYLFH